jgi:O-antigen/teichoic acid export membrane protein
MTGDPAPFRFRRHAARTSLANVAAAGAGALAGIVIARALGPTVRGEYAAVLAWFGMVLVIGQLGQTSATTYFVARHPGRGADYLATSRNLMVVSGAVTLAVGIALAPLLAAGDTTVTWGYRLMFATCLAGFVGASYTFSLQALHLPRWNLVRVVQPVGYAVAVGALHLLGGLELLTALALLSLTIGAQAVLAWRLCAGQGLGGGRGELLLARPLMRYGLSQLAASVPATLTSRLDKLVLSLAVVPAALGNYAVAASLTALAVPVTSGLGSVVFPRFASRSLSPKSQARLQRQVLWASAGIGVGLVLPMALLAPWFVPLVFGPGFDDAARLVLLLAPGGVFLACGQVCENLLRGHGRPLAVARSQVVAAVLMVAMLAALVPAAGVAGAAIAASTAPGVALVLMLHSLARLSRQVADGGAVTTAGGAPVR